MIVRPALALSLLGLAVACAPAGEGASESVEPAEYAVVDGWVRNPPGGRDVTAGYLTLTAGAPGGRLVAASSAEAERIELHTMAMDGAVMRMRRIEALEIPPHGAAILAPGGDHLMLFGVDRADLADGELALTLRFEDGETLTVTLPVRDTAPSLDRDAGAMSEG